MKYTVQFTNQFKKDIKLAKKQNKNLDKFFETIEILANGETLENTMTMILVVITRGLVNVTLNLIGY